MIMNVFLLEKERAYFFRIFQQNQMKNYFLILTILKKFRRMTIVEKPCYMLNKNVNIYPTSTPFPLFYSLCELDHLEMFCALTIILPLFICKSKLYISISIVAISRL